MFDMLTLDELYVLFFKLGRASSNVHHRMMDGLTPRVPVFSDEWAVLSASVGEINETYDAVAAEIQHREATVWDLAKPAMQTGLNDA